VHDRRWAVKMEIPAFIAGYLFLATSLLALPKSVTFLEPLEISIPGGFSLLSADWNGEDGYSDLATVVGGTTNGIEVVLSNGHGGFQPRRRDSGPFAAVHRHG
jgi:hypothetical protein